LYLPSERERFASLIKVKEDWRRLRECRMRILRLLLSGKQVVNLGCGVFTKKLMQKMGVTEDSAGVELDSYAVKQTKLQNPSCNIVKADVRFLPLKDKAFEYSVCSEVIEHLRTVKDATLLAEEMKRVSHTAVVTTPNSNYGVKIRDPTHYQFFNSRKLQEALGKEWKIYTTQKTLPKLFSYLLPYESPKIWFLHGFFRKLDYLAEFTRLNRLVYFVFRGAFLIALL
jgi:ubiquinone/menaquinone biosynthesis C-methylase UbiE